MDTVKLADAMEQGVADPEKAIPIHAGRCEARSGNVLCGNPARWWRWHQFRCPQHKDARV